MDWSTAILTIAIVLLSTLGVLVYRQCLFWKKRGVPRVTPVPIFGNTWKVFTRGMAFPEFAQLLYKSFPETRYFGLMDLNTPTLLVKDPEMIKDITVKNFEHFPDHRSFVDEEMDPLFGRNVFALKGERWRDMRTTLSPSFTASKMRFMFTLVSKCAEDLVDYLQRNPEYCRLMETKDAFTRYTNDVIASVAFGVTVNSMEDKANEFYCHGKDATSFGSLTQVIKFFMFRLCPSVMRLIGETFLSRSTTRFFKNLISENVKSRDEKGLVRPDMIHLLMQARDQGLTIDDIVAQAFIFFLAGFETSSTLMCFMVHELALNPEIQEKLRQEVDDNFEREKSISYETLVGMEYLDMVINETLRKYPPVPIIDRVCEKEFQLEPPMKGVEGYRIEKGVIVWLPVYALHHDPKYFPEPEKFDPERFSESRKNDFPQYAYLPFGIGPRKCIGNRFALMETKILLMHMLRKFVIKRNEKTVDPVVFNKTTFNMNVEGGYWVTLEPRN